MLEIPKNVKTGFAVVVAALAGFTAFAQSIGDHKRDEEFEEMKAEIRELKKKRD